MSAMLSSESSESVVDDLAMDADKKCVLVQSVKTGVNPCAVDWRGGRLLVSAYEYLEGSSPRLALRALSLASSPNSNQSLRPLNNGFKNIMISAIIYFGDIFSVFK
jgi:hypothetical protein